MLRRWVSHLASRSSMSFAVHSSTSTTSAVAVAAAWWFAAAAVASVALSAVSTPIVAWLGRRYSPPVRLHSENEKIFIELLLLLFFFVK